MRERGCTGIIETKSRILSELLSKTAFKDSLRLFLNSIDPENSPQFIRTLLGRDMEVPLAVAGTLPAIANCLIKALDELIIQVRDKFPPTLLAGFVESLLAEIDKETLKRLINETKDLGKDLSPAFKAAWRSVEDAPAPKEVK